MGKRGWGLPRFINLKSTCKSLATSLSHIGSPRLRNNGQRSQSRSADARRKHRGQLTAWRHRLATHPPGGKGSSNGPTAERWKQSRAASSEMHSASPPTDCGGVTRQGQAGGERVKGYGGGGRETAWRKRRERGSINIDCHVVRSTRL